MGYVVDCGRGDAAEDRAELDAVVAPPSMRAGLAQRARIVLLADERGRHERDRGAGRGVEADGDRVEEAVRGGGDRLGWRTGRSPAGRPGSTRWRWCWRRWSRRRRSWG